MVLAHLKRGSVIDGFLIEEQINKGGMATLWRVSHSDHPVEMLMKVPKLAEGEDPAAIVSFEMEQMIMPRLTGTHVPRFIAAGDFTQHPYIVMERLPGKTLLARLPELPLPYAEVAAIGARIATALDDLHRQNVIHLDIKPSNIMVRDTGEVVLLDYGLAHHDHLPDLMQEEFRLPYGSAPYISPEQLIGVRNEARSDLFALGVLLYFFTTGTRPFGESETLSGMKRRLWRDPVPPRKLKADYPPWLQEVVLRCLEVRPAWRYPTAAQLAFDLANPDQVKLTARSQRLARDPFLTVVKRRFNPVITAQDVKPKVATQISSAPIVMVALELQPESEAINVALRTAAAQVLATLPEARLACLNVLKTNLMTLDTTLDEHGHNKHMDRLIAIRHWAEPLMLEQTQLTAHVLEALDPAAAILEFADTNRVDHILVGARQNSMFKSLLGSVSGKIAGEAHCSVTVVRMPRARAGETQATAEGAPLAQAEPVVRLF